MKVSILDKEYFLNNKDLVDSFRQYKCNSAYQYYGWLKNSITEGEKNPLKKFNYYQKFAVLENEYEILAIAPIVIKKSGKVKGIIFLGYDTSSDYLDFLLKDTIHEKDIVFFVEEILRQTGANRFLFSGLREESLTFKALKNDIHFKEKTSEVCVKIPLLNECYDDFFSNLKKSVRQNIRTANNRLSKDNKKGELFVYQNNISREYAYELQSLYEKRRDEQNSDRKNLKYKLIKLRRKIGIYSYNYLMESMVHNKDSVVLVYKIDDKIAAFGHALKCQSGELEFMQVSFEKEFKRYSPGMLMFSDFIKYQLDNGDNSTIDLTVGTEKYKYDLGGEEHLVFSGVYELL